MAEKEYIDRAPFIGDLNDMKKGYYAISIDEMDKALANAPAFDVVDVCRCKDCEHYQPVTPTCGNCFRTTFIQHPDDFCSRGKRKEATP